MTDIAITPREAWGARAPKSRHTIATPTPELWLHHTAGNEQGAAGMRQIQALHMDTRGWSDIAYSFVIDPTTFEVFEGRGAGIAGGHTAGHNTTSHAICVMGNFDALLADPDLVTLIGATVAHGHERGWWPDHLSGGHRDTKATACPGQHLYAAIPSINARAKRFLNGDTPMPILDNDLTRRLQHALNTTSDLRYGLVEDGRAGELTIGAALHAVTALADERDTLKAALAAAEHDLEEERRQHSATRQRLDTALAAPAGGGAPVAVDETVAAKADLLDRFTEILYEIASTRG